MSEPNKFDAAWAPISEVEKFQTVMRAAVSSVQTSLYLRLKKRHGKGAGLISWSLIRLGQENHDDHAAALEALGRRSSSELSEVMEAVRLTRAKAHGDARWLLDDVWARLVEAQKVLTLASEI